MKIQPSLSAKDTGSDMQLEIIEKLNSKLEDMSTHQQEIQMRLTRLREEMRRVSILNQYFVEIVKLQTSDPEK